jgi:2-iminobutanoate/2-iminopropanoate deaminase
LAIDFGQREAASTQSSARCTAPISVAAVDGGFPGHEQCVSPAPIRRWARPADSVAVVDGDRTQRPIVPSTIAPPAARYAHAVLVTGPTRWLHSSGVVPVAPDGTVPAGVADQADVVWANIAAILADADMTPADVVSVTTYVVAEAMGDGLGQAMAARDRFLDQRLVASTLVTVPALAQPAWLIEIAVVAAA